MDLLHPIQFNMVQAFLIRHLFLERDGGGGGVQCFDFECTWQRLFQIRVCRHEIQYLRFHHHLRHAVLLSCLKWSTEYVWLRRGLSLQLMFHEIKPLWFLHNLNAGIGIKNLMDRQSIICCSFDLSNVINLAMISNNMRNTMTGRMSTPHNSSNN